MKVKVLGSGSSGNSYLLEDKDGNQLLLECGLKYEQIAPYLNFEKLWLVLCSHSKHSDHSKCLDKFKEELPYNTYSSDNLVDNDLIGAGGWLVKAFKVWHNVDCFGFLIFNTKEKKTIVFATDTTALPNQLSDKPYDLMMLECNYNFDKVIENAREGKLVNDGYKNHMALENLTQWLSTRECKPKNLMAIHLSEHGNLDKELMVEQLTPLADKFYIAKKGVEIEI